MNEIDKHSKDNCKYLDRAKLEHGYGANCFQIDHPYGLRADGED
jgi:hypothetical protein